MKTMTGAQQTDRSAVLLTRSVGWVGLWVEKRSQAVLGSLSLQTRLQAQGQRAHLGAEISCIHLVFLKI